MYLIYSALAFAEFFVLLASACAVIYVVVREIVRAFRKPDPETTRPSKESAVHLKRADARQSG